MGMSVTINQIQEQYLCYQFDEFIEKGIIFDDRRSVKLRLIYTARITTKCP